MGATQITLERVTTETGATLRICRPGAGNALSREAAEELSTAVDTLAADPPTGLVLAAEGERFFCTGGDLEDYRALTDRDMAVVVSLRMQDILGRLRALPSLLLDDAPVAPSYVGDVSMPNYEALRDGATSTFGASASGPSSKSFAGQAEDSFFLDLRVFDLLYGDQGTCDKEIGNDTLNGYNVNTLALQVPKRALVKGPGVGTEPVIGTWSTTSRKNASGGYTQVSRLGNPLVNEAVIPYHVKDTFNAIKPESDAAALPFVLEPELAYLLKNVCGVDAQTTNRQDLVTVFLKGVPGINRPNNLQAPSEQLRLNVNQFEGQTYSRLGVIGGDKNGFPNGRRLADDVVDIALQVVGGELIGNPNDLGDAVDVNASGFGSDFPYVALPHSGSEEQSSPPADTGETLLTRGDGRSPSDGIPVGQVAAIGLGLLMVIAGGAAARRIRPSPRPATA